RAVGGWGWRVTIRCLLGSAPSEDTAHWSRLHSRMVPKHACQPTDMAGHSRCLRDAARMPQLWEKWPPAIAAPHERRRGLTDTIRADDERCQAATKGAATARGVAPYSSSGVNGYFKPVPVLNSTMRSSARTALVWRNRISAASVAPPSGAAK